MLKYIATIAILSVFTFCSNKNREVENPKSESLDTTLLVNTFRVEISKLKSNAININKNLSDSLKDVINVLDSIQLNDKYQETINLYSIYAMLKLYNYHLECCQQAFNVNEMKKGEAKYIIDNALKYIKYSVKNPEMTASSIFYYSIKDTTNTGLLKDINSSIYRQLQILDKK